MYRSLIRLGAALTVALPLFLDPVLVHASGDGSSQIAPNATLKNIPALIIQPARLAEVIQLAQTTKILLVIGSWEMLERERVALENVGKKNQGKFSIIYVDPSQMPDIELLLHALVLGPPRYPTHLFIGGGLILPVGGGELREGAITKLVDEGLAGPQVKK